MPHHVLRAGAVVAACAALALPLTAMAQSQEPTAEAPEIEGLGWYTTVDVTGGGIETAFDDDEVEQWQAMLDVADASIDDLTYRYQRIVDPASLPQLGGLATVTIAGADEAAVLAAVLADISSQAVSLGAEPTTAEPITVGGHEVSRVDLPDVLGPDDAYVLVDGDTAWILVMQDSLVEIALQGMP